MEGINREHSCQSVRKIPQLRLTLVFIDLWSIVDLDNACTKRLSVSLRYFSPTDELFSVVHPR